MSATVQLKSPIPSNVRELDWKKLAREVKKVHSLTPAQREIYFENTVPTLVRINRKLYAHLINDLFECRGFHELAGLPYHDPKDENGQIIRVALISLLEG